jgi:hypothetical protein
LEKKLLSIPTFRVGILPTTAFMITIFYSLFREVCPLKQIYGKVIKIKGKCQKMKGEYQKCAFPPGKNNSIY